MNDQERHARAVLTLAIEPGDWRLLALVRQGGPTEVLDEVRRGASAHPLLQSAAERLAALDTGRELEDAARSGLRIVVPGDAEWPAGLDDLDEVEPIADRGGVPVGLWVKGPLRLDALASSVAIVGSRASTSYGEMVAGEIAAELGHAGVPVVSGAAFGIDYASHRGALTTSVPTVAVLACGADRVYPGAHRQLLVHLGEHHAVVSESPPGAAPHRIRFLSRNRLIAALTKGTVVVEAAVRSGALNTLNWAQQLNRVAMGVPGPVTLPTSVGVHQQIRLGATSLVTSGAEVLELVSEAGSYLLTEPRGPVQVRDRLRIVERQVLDAVPVARAAEATSIARVAGVGLREVRLILERLADAGLVDREGAGWRLTDAARVPPARAAGS